MDYKKFKNQLKVVTQDTFLGCKQRLPLSNIAGFALYSDASATTISASCNTFEHLDELKEDEPGNDIYFKWTPGEWKYEMINTKAFEPLCDNLANAAFKSGETKEFQKHRNKVYAMAVEVLEELKQEGLFEKAQNDFILVFAVSDFSDHNLEISFVNRLNAPELAEEFKNWVVNESRARFFS